MYSYNIGSVRVLFFWKSALALHIVSASYDTHGIIPHITTFRRNLPAWYICDCWHVVLAKKVTNKLGG